MENILPRREARENAFLLAFSQTFGDIPLQEALDNHHECDEEHPVDVFGQRLLRAYYEHSAEVDDLISAHLRNWTMERLPRVSLTVLRLGLAEMLYGDEKKVAVVINEAVEIAKAYGTDESAGFVNGVLGRIVRDRHLPSLQHVACTITAEDAEAACLAALWFEIDPKRLAAEEEAARAAEEARARFEADDYGFAEDDLDHIFNDPFDAEAGE